MMHNMLIEYDANGRITKVSLPDGSLFEVTAQQDQFVGGKLVSTCLSNLPVEGSVVGE